MKPESSWNDRTRKTWCLLPTPKPKGSTKTHVSEKGLTILSQHQDWSLNLSVSDLNVSLPSHPFTLKDVNICNRGWVILQVAQTTQMTHPTRALRTSAEGHWAARQS